MTKNQRQQHVDAWRQSGLSRSAYCRLHGLNKTTFARWVSRQAPPAERGGPDLIPVEVQREVAPSDVRPVVRLAGGARLELPAAVSPAWLAELLRCLG
jgi:hypothetical protein